MPYLNGAVDDRHRGLLGLLMNILKSAAHNCLARLAIAALHQHIDELLR